MKYFTILLMPESTVIQAYAGSLPVGLNTAKAEIIRFRCMDRVLLFGQGM